MPALRAGARAIESNVRRTGATSLVSAPDPHRLLGTEHRVHRVLAPPHPT
ncbi:hypothetical protein [Kitasatospora sp. NPDC001547]